MSHILRKNAEEINRLNRCIKKCALKRHTSRASAAAWHEVCAQFHARYDSLAFPGGLANGLHKISEGEKSATGMALEFLEIRPYYFRSGYNHKLFIRRLRQAPLCDEQRARFEEYMIRYRAYRENRESNKMLKLDHFALGCTDLEAGINALSDILGAKPLVRAKHELFSTYNALWRLETKVDPIYLELISIDPSAPKPKRKRWFGLDDPEVQFRLQSGFQLLTFVVNTNDFEAARKHLPTDPGKPVKVWRNDLVWQFSLHEDGGLIDNGALPYVIEWVPGPRPVENMANQNIRVLGVGGRRLADLDMGFGCPVSPSSEHLELHLMSARGKEICFKTA